MNTGEAGPSPSPYGDGKPESMPETKLKSRYIYYRLYLADGPIESVNPIYSNDHFISRILSKSVAPPHTAASLKKYLARTEGFSAQKCTLYLSLSEKAPVEDGTRLPIRGKSGPGLSEHDPMALVVDNQPSENRQTAASSTPVEQLDEAAKRYVHYRLYEENGEVASKTSFDESDSSLGRISTLSVPPPHTVASLKSHLIKAEGLSGRNFQLFEDEGGETNMNDGDSITLLTDTYPGVSEEEPIAVVYTAREEMRTTRPQAPVSRPHPPDFSKRLKALSGDMAGDYDPLWHSMTVGEIFHTDGRLMTEIFHRPVTGPESVPCYTAINASGKKAFIYAPATRFC